MALSAYAQDEFATGPTLQWQLTAALVCTLRTAAVSIYASEAGRRTSLLFIALSATGLNTPKRDTCTVRDVTAMILFLCLLTSMKPVQI